MPKITRISTTVTARYSPGNKAVDSFWLDGRMPGKRESRAADITLDREDKGFLFSVFATQSSYKDSLRDIEAVKPILEKTTMEIKHSSKNIDNQIPELAECSVEVSGKVSLDHEGTRQPFFAGAMVKNSEIAAVTMGRGCAYVYRNDTLYPLTNDDLDFDPVDYSGKEVEDFDIYCAGVAGTVRYSHIAQLHVDDCIILCNKEIMESIGQKEMLRILDEAYDQCDAAGAAITAAAAKMPGIPMQIMIGFVENITQGEKTGKTMAFTKPSRTTKKTHEKAEEFEDEEKVKDIYTGDDDDEDYYEEDYFDDEPPSMKKVALAAVISIVLIACGIVIYTLVTRTPSETQQPTSTPVETSTPEPTTPPPTPTTQPETSEETETPPEQTPDTGPEIIDTYRVQEGDNLAIIANKFYGSSDIKYQDAIIAANIEKYPSFTHSLVVTNWVLDIPKVDD